jgi:hypothetical protein
MMGFGQLKGLLARRGDLRFDRPVQTVELPQDFEFVPMDEAVNDRVGAALAAVDIDTAGELTFLVATVLECLGAEPRPGSTVVHILANPFGQYTYAFRDGEVTAQRSLDYVAAEGVPSEDMPINRVLRQLGVQRDGAPDEVTALGLDLPAPHPPG